MHTNFSFPYMKEVGGKEYFEKYIERSKALGNTNVYTREHIGYVYWQKGYKEEAEYYFNEQINIYMVCNCKVLNRRKE